MTPPGPERRPAGPATPATSPSRAGLMLGKCRLVRPIGRGGMGDVYLAEHTLLKRQVAIKILPPQLTRDPELLARFHREAVAAARLDHPNIVHVMDVGVQGGLHYILMQYVEGRSLQALLDKLQGPMDLKEAARVIAATARGLQAAHEAGIVHRDVKPANILISDKGEVKISDFGIAHDVAGQTLTAPGEAMGTPDFMSPEQAEGGSADPRSDIYSLGVTLFTCITGARPFSGENHMAVLYKHLHEDPPPPKVLNPRIPDPLSKLVLKMMAKDPKLRYATATDVAKDLELFIKDGLRNAPGMKADSSVLRGRPKSPPGSQSTHGTHSSHGGSAPPLRALPRPPVAPTAMSRKSAMIGIGAGFVAAAVALIAWATSGRATPSPSPSRTPSPSAAPDLSAAKRERYRSLVARARELESSVPDKAELLYQDAASEWPEGPEAREGLARLARKPSEDEQAWQALLAQERAGLDELALGVKLAEFRQRHPESPHAAEAAERFQRLQEKARRESMPPLEDDFTWLAATSEEADRNFRIVGPKPKVTLKTQEIEVDTTGMTSAPSLATRAEDITDFVFRCQLKVDEGRVNIGGRFALKLTTVFQGYPLDPVATGWSEVELEISGDSMTLCRTGAARPRITTRHAMNSAGSVILLFDPGTRVTMRYPRIRVISRDEARLPAGASPSPSASSKPDPTPAPPPDPVEPAGELMPEGEIARVFGDGREAAARDYGALLKRLKAKVDESDGALQSALRDNLVRVDLARGIVEASLAAIGERKGREAVLKTRDGRTHTLRITTVDAAEVSGTSAEFGGELVLMVANLHTDTLLEYTPRPADLDAACFLLTEGDVAGAVKRLFSDARKLKPSAPAGPLLDHLLSMDLLHQLRGGAADLRAAADRLVPAADQLGEDARAGLERLKERLELARGDAVRREALALAGKSRYKEAIAKYLEWVRSGPKAAAVDDVANDLYAAFLAEGWKKHWTEGDPAAAFEISGKDGSTVVASGREFSFAASRGALTLALRGVPEASGLAAEVKVLDFTGKHGFNLVCSREGNDAGLFAMFATSWRIDRRVGGEFKAVAASHGHYASPEGRWVEMAVFTLGPHDYFFLDRALVHREDAGLLKIVPGCGFLAEEQKTTLRNVRIRLAK